MAKTDRDEAPMLSDTSPKSSDGFSDSRSKRSSTSWTRSISASIPMNSTEPREVENYLVGHTGPLRSERRIPFIPMSGPLYAGPKLDSLPPPDQRVPGRDIAEHQTENYLSSLSKLEKNEFSGDSYIGKNEHLLRSGQLGMCNDPYCTTCPSTYYNFKAEKNYAKATNFFDSEFHNALYGDAKGWARRTLSTICSYIPGVMNPHARVVQKWNKFFVISCLVAIFVDPLFFLLLSVQKNNKCIVIDGPMAIVIVVFRSLTDFIYLLHMLLQFKLAYIAPESRVVGAGELVDHPKKIALHYLSGYFVLDFFVVLPLPQIMILLVLPKHLGSSGANYAKNLLRAAVLVQYIPRLYRFLPFFAGQSPNGFIFESAWANFFINLLTYVLSSHVVGSGWYLLGLQRVNQCLRDACHNSGIESCMKFIDCGHGNDIGKFNSEPMWKNWKNNVNATACFSDEGFPYGIYVRAVNLTTESSISTRYTYSLFWGFQQISTLAGNQVPSYFIWEVLFTMAIIGLGLLLFALLIGNMQNFLQALGRRRLEMLLRGHDVEQWMKHRRLPEVLKRQVRDAERYNWAATRGVNEEMLLEKLPEDLQRDIRRHLFKFVKKVRILALMDQPILDSICERLRQKTYIQGSIILYPSGVIEQMVFIVRGKMESIGEDNIVVPLCEGDVCGEELLTWCLDKDSRKNKIAQRLISNRLVKCLTNVEVFTLRATDLEEVTSLFARMLRNPRVHGAIRYESPYWRGLAATSIQVAWRYRKRRQSRATASVPSQATLKNN